MESKYQLAASEVMELIQEERASELLHAQAQLWNHAFSFMKSMSLKCAVELGIPDIIHSHGKPITLPELVTALSIPTSKTGSFRRLMRVLVHSGLIATQTKGSDGVDRYRLTPSSRILVTENKACVSPFLLLILDSSLLNPSLFLGAWFKGDEPTPFGLAHSSEMWELANQSSNFNSLFNDGMASDACLVSEVVKRGCGGVFGGLRSLVDVGGGTGTMARAIAEAFPQVKCTVYDLPHVIATLSPERPNIDLIGGDMFEYIPQADAVLLKWILHDWNDEACVKILGHCKEAIPSKEEGGKVIIMDMVVGVSIGNPVSVETQLLFDLEMMLLTTGKERDESEWKKLFLDAGFKEYKITPSLGLRSIIEVYA